MLKQCPNPLNCLSAFFPISAASLVLAKSKGYTKIREEAPAAPPLNTFPKKNLSLSVLGLYGQRYFLKESLKAKFNAWVGKYLRTLAKLPLHKEVAPSSLTHLMKQSVIPLYFLAAPVSIFLFAS